MSITFFNQRRRIANAKKNEESKKTQVIEEKPIEKNVKTYPKKAVKNTVYAFTGEIDKKTA